MYAPLPDSFPVKSIDMLPSGARTILISSFFAFDSEQPMHLRSGILFFGRTLLSRDCKLLPASRIDMFVSAQPGEPSPGHVYAVVLELSQKL